jgi:signal transduction histidine kinase
MPGWTNVPVLLKGTVLCQERDLLIVGDAQGVMNIQMDPFMQPLPQAGQIVTLEGSCWLGRSKISGEKLVVDNDGNHRPLSKSGTIFLAQGLNPIRVEWFNGVKTFALDVEWSGPQMPRGAIPDEVLFRAKASSSGTNRWGRGLDYYCYEGVWDRLPDFLRLPVCKQGFVANFDVGVRARDEGVGIVFAGCIEVPREGLYTFWTTSDDGSKLYVGPPTLRINCRGTAPLPPLLRLHPSQSISEEFNNRWAAIEGTVTFVNSSSEDTVLEVSSNTGQVRLQLAQRLGRWMRQYSMGCHIDATGICQTALTLDGKLGFSLWVPSLHQIKVIELPAARWSEYPVVPIRTLVAKEVQETMGVPVHVSGIVCSNFPDGIVIEDKTGRIQVRTGQSLPQVGDETEAIGQRSQAGANVFLENGVLQPSRQKTSGDLPPLHLLTQAVQVKTLTRSETERGYPVKIKGVITARLETGYVIQDESWSIYFILSGYGGKTIPKVGEFWEIEGTTEMRFAPIILVRSAVYRGPGILPEPLHPAWDELINGSTDTQFIEIQGVVLAVQTNRMVLLTYGGQMRLELLESDLRELDGLENALVRIRGVSSPARDLSLQTVPAQLRLFHASVIIYQPPTAPFATPLKHISDLLSFDANANGLQRVRVAGQLIHVSHGEYFLMDGTHGLRFRLKSPQAAQIGDLVEVEGFPDVAGPSPSLREALLRQTGHAGLPAPYQLDGISNGDVKLDATLVSIKAVLTSLGMDGPDSVLSLQAGNHGFVARMENRGEAPPNFKLGSQLELTGVYVESGGTLSPGINLFELLLNSPADIRVLAQPSWWTARHALIVFSGMLLILLITLVWVTQLHRQVEDRTAQLAVEIRSRERAERQRVLEEERSRIARDLHDDLGASLTQIRFLSEVNSSNPMVSDATRTHLKQVSEKTHQMVVSLDEIVWAVNPANDSLASLAAYLCHVAREFFENSGMNCRLEVDSALPKMALNSELRHNLCLSVREALNNSAKHSQATELWLRIRWQQQCLQITIEDNGCGFADSPTGEGKDGLANIRRRLERIGGQFVCHSQVNAGTTYVMTVPLPQI